MAMHNSRWLKRTVVLASVVLASLTSAVLTATPAHADEPRSTRISRAEIISRAQDWWRRKIPYSQSASASDVEGTNYRTDCSGFVSMAWRLESSYTTATLPNVASPISKSSLQAGDILLRHDSTVQHTLLFEKWYDSAHTQFWAYEEASTAADMNHEVKSLSSYSSYTAYKYGDGDGNFDSYHESFDEVDGIESDSLTTTSDYCHRNDIDVIRLTNMHNVDGAVYTCVRYEPSDNSIRGWMVFSWWPATGDDDSADTVGAKFDGFGLHPQLQVGNITHREAKCWIGGEINNAASGVRGCYVAMTRTSGTWSLDGWVNWDENNDGLTWYGPFYQYGSSTIG
jgi:hypothetical protein